MSTVATPRRHRATDLVVAAAAAIRASPHVGLLRAADARADAADLLTHVVGRPLVGDEMVPDRARRRFQRLVRRRVAGEPVALLLGEVEFCGLRLAVRQGTFAPRASTEALALAAVRRLARRRTPVAVDVATGVGPVALAVAAAVPGAVVWGLDISPRAISVARANARRLGLTNVHFRRSDGLARLPAALRGRIDVVTVHPPYVPRSEVDDLPDEVRHHEPRHTLTDESADGLGLVRELAAAGTGWLRPGGWLLVEVSPDRARAVRSALVGAGLTEVRSRRHALPVTRIVVGRRP